MSDSIRLRKVVQKKVSEFFISENSPYTAGEWNNSKMIEDLIINRDGIGFLGNPAGHNIRYIRKDVMNITQDELGAYLEVKRTTISAWENGENDIPLHHLIKIADLFRLSLDILCLREEYLKDRGILDDSI